jgi:outer membrane protein OmpA-like peptidoglycan-associated protein
LKHLFTILCWGVIALGLLLACSKKVAPPVPTDTVERARVPGMPKTKLAEAVPLEDVDIPQTVTVYFPLNSDHVLEAWTLDAVGKALRASEGLQATVTGHACPLGDEPYNEYLGLRRARAVAMHLESAGVPAWRLKAESMGERRPLTRERHEFPRNRRAEITFERKIL